MELFDGRFEILHVLLLVWLLGEDFRFESPNWGPGGPVKPSIVWGGGNQSMVEDPTFADAYNIGLFASGNAGGIDKADHFWF